MRIKSIGIMGTLPDYGIMGTLPDYGDVTLMSLQTSRRIKELKGSVPLLSHIIFTYMFLTLQ